MNIFVVQLNEIKNQFWSWLFKKKQLSSNSCFLEHPGERQTDRKIEKGRERERERERERRKKRERKS